MKYSFKDMLNSEIYETARVMFIVGKYNIFNNLVANELKAVHSGNATQIETVGIADEFGFEADDLESSSSSSVDFDTFMDVNAVANINGLWICRTELQSLNSKQKDKLMKYIKTPSDNGILIVSCSEWKTYKDLLRNKIISFSKNCHLLELSFPSRDILKSLVIQLFEDKNIEIQPSAADLFITKMSKAYDEYDQVINDIQDAHGSGELTVNDLKGYMKGIQHYDLDDFVGELTKPLSSDKTNSKKVLKIMSILEDEMGARNLVYKLLSSIEIYIDFRILINNGNIPITINYFFKDVVKDLDEKYQKMNEWKFRKQASVAAQTSLRDWEYMKLILFKAIENNRLPEEVIEMKCKKALYEVCTRSVLTPDRINNIIGIDNILTKQRREIDKIIYDEKILEEIKTIEELAETS